MPTKVAAAQIKTDRANIIAGTNTPCKNFSWPSWTNNKSGTTTNKDKCVAARTVFTRSESISENDVVIRTAESAPKIDATATVVVISGCENQ